MIKIFKKINNLEHYALWLFMFLFIFDYHFWGNNWAEAIGITGMEIAFYVLIFYLNYKIVIPRFLEKGHRFFYLFSLLLFLLGYIFIIKTSGIEAYLYEGEFWRNALSMTINFGLFWLISTLYWYYQKLQEEREIQLKNRAEKLETELRFLKNQISPHFIFNTLNNIYSLVQQGHKNAAPMLAQLSTILRYILYESSREEVLLEKELNTIKDYIELQLFRKPKSSNVDFYQEGNVLYLKIAPLILLNFVENCFKHGNLAKSDDAWIKISCFIDDNQQLEFITENSKEKAFKKQEENGLGNKNIRRQLEINYPNAHELIVEETDDFFRTRLILQLDT